MNRSIPLFNHRALRVLAVGLTPVAAVRPRAAQAVGLPVLQEPSRGAGNGILQTLQNYSYDIVLLVALLVIAAIFIGVSYHAYNQYSEIHTGRKTWGEFGLTVAVGAILLVVAIWLLTNATTIL